MKLGINNEVNTSTKKAALQLMAGGKSKINPPNSHPSNQIHKAATAESKKDPKPAIEPETNKNTTCNKKKIPIEPQTQNQTNTYQTKETTEQTEEKPTPTAGSGSESHDVNKIAVVVGAVAVAGLMFLSFR